MSSDPQQSMSIPDRTVSDPPRFVDPSEAFDSIQEIAGRKWHFRIVYHLLEDGPMGFSALKRSLEGVSSKMLSESLTTLEEHGLLRRSIVSDQPIRVEYTLTDRGVALEPAITALLRWNAEFDESGP